MQIIPTSPTILERPCCRLLYEKGYDAEAIAQATEVVDAVHLIARSNLKDGWREFKTLKRKYRKTAWAKDLFEALLFEVKLLEHQGIPVLRREASQIERSVVRLPRGCGLGLVNLEGLSTDSIYSEKHRGYSRSRLEELPTASTESVAGLVAKLGDASFLETLLMHSYEGRERHLVVR